MAYRLSPLLAAVIALVPDLSTAAMAEKSEQQIAIEKLAFLTGDWAGPGVSYRPDGSTTAYHDTEAVWFDVQNSVLIIQANGYDGDTPTYSLHTIIDYRADEGHYRYTTYGLGGGRSELTCDLIDAVFTCQNDAGTYRLFFQRTADGKWNEYGERLTDGVWRKNFETLLEPAAAVE